MSVSVSLVFLLVNILFTIASYDVINTLAHDSTCFTQGLVYVGDYLYESCGLNGQSVVKQIDRNSYKVLKTLPLDNTIFAEGLTYYDNHLFLLTYLNKKILIIHADTLQIVGKRRIKTVTKEGWGVTHDNKQLIVSDGSSKLMFYDFPTDYSISDPETLRHEKNTVNSKDEGLLMTHSIDVKRYPSNQSIAHINELEYVNGYIFANVWYKDIILKIDPITGYVIHVYDMSHLYPLKTRSRSSDCLNGIAYNPATNTFLITGKKWPFQYIVHFSNSTDLIIQPPSATRELLSGS